MERLMKPAEVAPFFSVEPSTVKEWAKTGKIPSTKTPGGQYRVRFSDVAAYMTRDANTEPENDNGPVRCANT